LSAGLTTPPRKKTIVQESKELSRTALRKRPWKRNKAFDLNLATWNIIRQAVLDDIKALGIRRWRIKAQDRNEWTALKREAKVKLKGP
jgi:hypothetical protein